MESKGTIKFLRIALPIIKLLDADYTLIADELNANLHSDLTKFIINKIHENFNSNGQLIMTTHDTSLLNDELFRRDQVYLVNRAKGGYTYLDGLKDFSPRKEQDKEKIYLAGEIGGVPHIRPYYSVKLDESKNEVSDK